MLDRIHKIAEILSAIAIVASLIFVGIQISQNTDATRISNAQSALNSWNDVSLALATDDGLQKAIWEGTYPELRVGSQGSKERLRYISWLFAGVKAVENNFLQWRDGNLSDDLWHGYRENMLQMAIGSVGLADYWAANAYTHSEPFQAFMDEIFEEAAVRRAALAEQLKQQAP